MSTIPRTHFEQVFKITVILKASTWAQFSQQCHNRYISPYFTFQSSETVRTVWPPGTEELLWPSRALAGYVTLGIHLIETIGQIVLRGLQWEWEKLLQNAAYMLQTLRNPCRVLCCKLGLWPLTVTRPSCGQWAFCDWVSQDRCSFRNSRKVGLGPRRLLKGPIHSFHPAAFLASSHSLSLSHRGPNGSTNLWSVVSPPPEPIPGRKES